MEEFVVPSVKCVARHYNEYLGTVTSIYGKVIEESRNINYIICKLYNWTAEYFLRCEGKKGQDSSMSHNYFSLRKIHKNENRFQSIAGKRK